MARFYGTMEGRAKTVASRISHEGVRAHVRGWGIGAKTCARRGGEGVADTDYVELAITGGSNHGQTLLNLGTWKRVPDGKLSYGFAVVPADARAQEIWKALAGGPV